LEISNIVEALIKLPSTFQRVHDKSILAFLEEMGGFEVLDKIAVRDICEMLGKNSERVAEWLQYSEDKRCSPSWYFIQTTESEYIVGYMNEEGDINLYEEN